MKVQIKVYGTLRRQFSDYHHSRGIEVEIPDGSSVKDLLEHLKIPDSRGALVVMENRILETDDLLPGCAQVSILQAIGGG